MRTSAHQGRRLRAHRRYRETPEGTGLPPLKRERRWAEAQQPPEEWDIGTATSIAVIEKRRRVAEGVLWQLPGIGLAAQAFLLGAGLDSNAERSSQIAVGSLGIAAVLGTVLIVRSQALRATIFERWLAHTVYQSLTPDELAKDRPELNPGKTGSVDRALIPRRLGGRSAHAPRCRRVRARARMPVVVTITSPVSLPCRGQGRRSTGNLLAGPGATQGATPA